ncbi:DUF4118 domain-containing protein [Clostridium sp. MCC353]|uniref:DUF4118 domain-containing protein n=1 Tax=Clostridium sp. MCC353 TaxID=2592646 RepID=UPI0020792C40|nr:DUF4118 domain-containing protein [Clostridium sp. MCC353]MBT9777108.1 DUF4118 domain-containing protein [Clostridium sp. MCC353]
MENRPDPNKILAEHFPKRRDDGRGRLKIFFGYAAGVGKTYAMLEAARDDLEAGIDVAAGYIEPHERPETLALMDGMELLTPRFLEYRGIRLREFDLDAALIRKPEILLVDELAHTNPEGFRHSKRYQDIQELLEAGVNVYTTVNVQHLESLHDIVASITHIRVKERIPDRVFDLADQVELIDIEPEELMKRLEAGKIYRKAQAGRAMENFFTLEKLTALREIALRRTADRVNRAVSKERGTGGKEYYTAEHILVCVSSAPSNEKVIRTAARMADAFHGDLTAIVVKTEGMEEMSGRLKNVLENNIALAKQFGANAITVYGDDIAQQIAGYARRSGVSKIVIGRTVRKRRMFYLKQTLIDRLIKAVPNMDIYVIPDSSAVADDRKKPVVPPLTGGRRKRAQRWLQAAGILAGAAAFLVLLYNFFFVEPRYSFYSYAAVYPFTFAIMAVCAVITGSMAARLKKQAEISEEESGQMQALMNISHRLKQAGNDAEKLEILGIQASELLRCPVIIYQAVSGGGGLKKIGIYPPDRDQLCRGKLCGNEGDSAEMFEKSDETAVAEWVCKNKHKAGKTTDTLPGAQARYMPVAGTGKVYGVVGIDLRNKGSIEPNDKNILNIMISETVSALKTD